MRWRTINVLTNTPPRTQQRSPGPMQANGLIEPAITKAAKQLGIDQNGRAYGQFEATGVRPTFVSRLEAAIHDRLHEIAGGDTGFVGELISAFMLPPLTGHLAARQADSWARTADHVDEADDRRLGVGRVGRA